LRKFMSKILLRLTRRSRLKEFRELNRNQYRPRGLILKQQEEKLGRLIRHAIENVPYYKRILKNINIRNLDDLADVPFLTKQKIHDNIEELKAENIPEDRFILNSTGGSTGEKLIFYNDRNSKRAPFLMRGNSWTGWEIGDKQVQLWGAHYDMPAAKGISEKLKQSLIHRKIMMSSYDMTEEDMNSYCRTINRYRPALITGYSSALYLLSEFIERNRLSIYSPEGMVSSAETLHPHQRETIESVFRSKVLDRYGCREVGNIAHECQQQNGLHIFSEHVLLEVVDSDGNRCSAGETGEIVVTKLDNFAFPFIRYRIGDIGVMSERECPCGRNLPMLEEVKGRVFDLIVGTNGNHLSGTFWTILLREYVEGIRKYQVIQREYGKLLLRLIVDDRYDREGEKKLKEKIREKCGRDMSIKIELVEEFPLTESGKHRFIISEVSPFAD